MADQLAELNNGAQPDSLSALPQDLESLLNDAIAGKADSTPAAAPAPAPVVAPAPATAVVAAPVAAVAITSPDGLDWEGMYQAVMPAGSYTRPAIAAVAAAPAAAPAATAAAPSAPSAPAATAPAVVAARREAPEKRDERPQSAPAKEESIRIDA